jgi:hypothetical protein
MLKDYKCLCLLILNVFVIDVIPEDIDFVIKHACWFCCYYLCLFRVTTNNKKGEHK